MAAKRLLAIAGAALICLCSAAPSFAARLPKLNNGYQPEIRPKSFYGWSGDGSLVLGGPSSEPPLPNQAGGSVGKIKWTVWNAHKAVGRGVVWYDDCEPDCGTGHWHSEPPTPVKAWRVRSGQFTRLRVKMGEGARRRWYVFAYKSPYPPQWTNISAKARREPAPASRANAGYRSCVPREPALAMIFTLHRVSFRTACRVTKRIVSYPWPESDMTPVGKWCVNRLGKVHEFEGWNVKVRGFKPAVLSRHGHWFTFLGQEFPIGCV